MMDFSQFKKLTIGGVELKQLLINGIQVWKAISYTNQIPISTDASGNIYNGKGYKANVFVHTNGDSSMSGYYSTGYIPCAPGSVIRLKNAPLLQGNAYCRIAFFDSNKTRIGHANAGATYIMNTVFKGVLDSNNNYVELTVKEYSGTSAGMAYVRFTTTYLGADSVITINQEITD